MQLEYIQTHVVSNEQIYDGIYKLGVKIPEKNLKIKSGQFFMLRAWGSFPTLSRPISVHDADEDVIYFLYQIKGKGTKLFECIKEKDKIEILGPCGNGFDTNLIEGKIAVVAGGIGVAPMQYLIKNLKNCEIDFYGGFRDKSFGIEIIKSIAQNVHITTETGNEGTKGYITEILKPENYDIVLTCGPEIMMKKVVSLCSERNIPSYVSMEKHMACGIGACLCCTCKTKDGMKRSCIEGPVFKGEDVIFDD